MDGQMDASEEVACMLVHMLVHMLLPLAGIYVAMEC